MTEGDVLGGSIEVLTQTFLRILSFMSPMPNWYEFLCGSFVGPAVLRAGLDEGSVVAEICG